MLQEFTANPVIKIDPQVQATQPENLLKKTCPVTEILAESLPETILCGHKKVSKPELFRPYLYPQIAVGFYRQGLAWVAL